MMTSSQLGHVEVVRLLLGAGADKNSANKVGTTAMMTASQLGHVEVVRLLLGAGADKNLASNSGTTALMRSSQQSHVEVVRLLRAASVAASADASLRLRNRHHTAVAVPHAGAGTVLLTHTQI